MFTRKAAEPLPEISFSESTLFVLFTTVFGKPRLCIKLEQLLTRDQQTEPPNLRRILDVTPMI